jgi:ribonuclease BN (tRNA processing enzyme)
LIEIDGDEPLIVDLGTGLRALGADLMGGDLMGGDPMGADPMGADLKEAGHAIGPPLHASALLSHLHFDHILGLPFFGPLQEPGSRLTVHGPAQADGSLKDALHAAVQPPVFPIHMDQFGGEIIMIDTRDEDFSIGSAKVLARAIPHCGTTLGYRIEADGRSLAYLPDHQAPLDGRSISAAVLELCHDVDLLVHDGQYTDDEFSTKSDWGHSTAAFAVRVAAESRAKNLVLTHHDPSHDDSDLDRMLSVARSLPEAGRVGDVSMARESHSIDLGQS